MANANIALSKETLQNLTKLSEFTKQPAQELAEKLLREAIELEMEDFQYLKFLMSVMLKVQKQLILKILSGIRALQG